MAVLARVVLIGLIAVLLLCAGASAQDAPATDAPSDPPVDAPSAPIDWATITKQQIEGLSTNAFQTITSSQLASIPDESISGLSSAQLQAIPSPACGGFREGHFVAMDPAAFQGFAELCILATTPIVWSRANSTKLDNLSPAAFHGFKREHWKYIPGPAVSGLGAAQAVFLRHNTCKEFTFNQISHMTASFLKGIVPECVEFVPTASWAGISASGMVGFQHNLRYINAAEVVPEIAGPSWTKLTDNFAVVCPFITPTQVPYFQEFVFLYLPDSCARTIPADSWRAITPKQIAAVRLDAFATDLEYIRLLGLKNESLAAITPEQWNMVPAKNRSSLESLTMAELFRLVAVARSNFLNFEQHYPVNFSSTFIATVKRAIDFAPDALRTEILVSVWPQNAIEFGKLSEWSWLHFAFLKQGPPAPGFTAEHVQLLDAQALGDSLVPLSGVRRRIVPSFTPGSMQVMSVRLIRQILPDTCASLTSSQMNVMTNIAYLSAECWKQVSPSVLADLSMDTLRKVNLSIIESLACDQVAKVDVDTIYKIYNANNNDPMILAFKIAMQRCTLWREPIYGLPMQAIVMIAAGSGAVFVSLVGTACYCIYRRRRRSATSMRSNTRDDVESMRLLDH